MWYINAKVYKTTNTVRWGDASEVDWRPQGLTITVDMGDVTKEGYIEKEAANTFAELISEDMRFQDVPWVFPGPIVWVFNLDTMKEAFPELGKIIWLTGIVALEADYPTKKSSGGYHGIEAKFYLNARIVREKRIDRQASSQSIVSSTIYDWGADWFVAKNAEHQTGGQGRVIRVINRTNGRQGALKELHTDHLRNMERRKRMAREVEALERASGEGSSVPKVLGHNLQAVSDRNVQLYIISEWVEGQTLQEFSNGRKLPVEDAVPIVRELAVIVKRCHTAGVYHRDIKPDNIIISRDTQHPVLVDFGIAWVSLDPEGTQDFKTETQQDLRNRFLHLPEMAASGYSRDEPRADITYLVGVLFFLLTGRKPVQIADKNNRPPHRVYEENFSKTVVNSDRWSLIQSLFDRGFQPNVDERFQTVDELMSALDATLAQKLDGEL